MAVNITPSDGHIKSLYPVDQTGENCTELLRQVEDARIAATRLHSNQTRRDKVTPYIVHPAAVAALLDGNPSAQIIAWLHDTLEDCNTSLEELNKEFGIHMGYLLSVECLTKRDGEAYTDYLSRVSQDSLATKVKIADMIANLADNPTPKQVSKYTKGLAYLLGLNYQSLAIGHEKQEISASEFFNQGVKDGNLAKVTPQIDKLKAEGLMRELSSKGDPKLVSSSRITPPASLCDLPCPKCGGKDLLRTWRDKGDTWSAPSGMKRSYCDANIECNEYGVVRAKRECLIHHCRVCQFNWTTLTLEGQQREELQNKLKTETLPADVPAK